MRGRCGEDDDGGEDVGVANADDDEHIVEVVDAIKVTE